jgi:hypothetical protein
LECFGKFAKIRHGQDGDCARQQTDYAEACHNQEIGIGENRNDLIGNTQSAKDPAIHCIENEALGAPSFAASMMSPKAQVAAADLAFARVLRSA